MADVELDCGCTVVVTHTRGDRVVHCKRHLRIYRITAQPEITYKANAMQSGGGDAA